MREIKNSRMDKEFDLGMLAHRIELWRSNDFTYGHFCLGSGYVTICGGRIGDKLYYGLSFCSPKDNFSRIIGRNLAIGNLLSEANSHFRGVLHLDENMLDDQPAVLFQKAITDHISKMKRSRRPQWAKNQTVEFRNKSRNNVDSTVVG